MADISVVVPVFNSVEYLEECVESVLNQTIESDLIIVDDGSQDPRAVRVLEEFGQRDRVRLLRKENGGASSARNLALREAKTRFIMPLDSDDLLHPTYCEQAVEVLTSRSEIWVVSCQTWMFGAITGLYGPPFTYGRLLAESILPSGAAFRREQALLVGGFDESLPRFEDQDFFIRLLAASGSPQAAVVQIPERLYLYRKHAASVTARALGEGDIDLRAYVLRKNAKIYADYAFEYLAYLDQQSELLGHFKRRYGSMEDFVSKLGGLRRKMIKRP